MTTLRTEAGRRLLVTHADAAVYCGTNDERMAEAIADIEAESSALWVDVVKFVRWSANVRSDDTDAIAVARALLLRIEGQELKP